MNRLTTLNTPQELKEINAVFPQVKLKRTYNQKDFKGGIIKFWRVTAPTNHPNLNSDLSIEGLKDWGIIR